MNRMIPITISPGATTAACLTDRLRKRLAHHPAARGDQHEEERAEQLGREPSPLLPRILEIGHRIDDLDLEPPLKPTPLRCP